MNYDQLSDDELINAINAKIGGGQPARVTSQPQGVVNTGANIGGASFTNLEGKRAEGQLENDLKKQLLIDEEGIKGITSDLAGRAALARDSLKRIDNIINLLFPNGEISSYDRPVSWASNYPFGKTPITPKSLPDIPGTKKDDDLAFKGQSVDSDLSQAIAGKLLIQTGVASNPEEREEMKRAYEAGLFKSPRKVYSQLSDVKKFYEDFLNIVDRHGHKGVNPKFEEQNKDPLGIR